jgi:hypothetical protein
VGTCGSYVRAHEGDRGGGETFLNLNTAQAIHVPPSHLHLILTLFGVDVTGPVGHREGV